MLLTPLLLVLVDRLLAPRLAARAQGQALDEIAQDQHAPIIICGFGRYGQIVGLVQAHFAQATLVARARDVTHWYGLHSRGVQHIERETLDSALLSGRSVLELMGWERHAARNQALRFRQHTIDLMVQMAPHQGDEKKLISAAKQGRQELEPMGSKEREQRADSKARRGEGFSTRQPSSTGDDAG